MVAACENCGVEPHWARSRYCRECAVSVKCSEGGCERKRVAATEVGDLCDMHYRRWRRTGTTARPARIPHARCEAVNCSGLACGRIAHSHKLCDKHRFRMKRHGTTADPIRVLDRYEVVAAGCWRWTGFVSDDGYGRISRHYGESCAHRYFYRELVGPIPPGMELDHLCRNRGCVNPAHLEPVTHQENVRRGALGYGSRRVCKAGIHDISASSAWHINPNGTRTCAGCYELNYKEQNRRRTMKNSRWPYVNDWAGAEYATHSGWQSDW